MSKITLNDAGTLNDVVSTINTNNDLIEEAFDNTLSRDGTTPNTMESDLDMNSNRILNLPQPTTATQPLRLQDLNSWNNSTVNITNVGADNIVGLPTLSLADDTADFFPVYDTSAAISKRVLGANLGFTQAGTGAQLRALQAKLRDFVSVLDFIPITEHAAIRAYSSVLDLRSYINAAITYLMGIPGGTLYFPAGRYTITNSIGFSGMRDIYFVGDGGRDLTYAGNSGTVIRFTGTGGGDIVTMNDHRGIWWENIQVVYTSNSFTGTGFNCASSFQTGNGSGFKNVQLYQITNNGLTGGQGFYLKNCVDMQFDGVYISHYTMGWLGLFDGDPTAPTNETNVIRLTNCTTIALSGHAIVNPIIGWTIVGCNFEATFGGAPSGINCTGAHNVTNLSVISCIFADLTSNGTWINLPVSVFGFNMIGGALLTNVAATATGILLGAGGKAVAGVNIQGVLFSGLNIGINVNVAGVIAQISGNNFLGVSTAISNPGNLDATCMVMANNGLASRALAATAGGTGQTSYTIGDILIAGSSTTLGKVVAPAVGNTLISQGASVQPVWGKVNPATHLSHPIIYSLPSAIAVNMNSVADTTFNVTLPTGFTRYRVNSINISHASTDLTSATTVQFGLFSATGGGGTTILSATAATVSATAENTALNVQFQNPSLTALLNFSQLFFRVTTAHGSAATADVTIMITPYP